MSAVRLGDRVRFTIGDEQTYESVEGTVWSNGSRAGHMWVLDDDAGMFEVANKNLTLAGAEQLTLDLAAVSA